VIYPSFFAAAVFGVIGIFNDRRKFLAFVAVAFVVAVVLFPWLLMYYCDMLQ